MNDKELFSFFKSQQVCDRDFENLSYRTWIYALKEFGFNGFSDFKKYHVGYKNHKVASIEFVKEEDDVYCMTVVGPNGEKRSSQFRCLWFQTFA